MSIDCWETNRAYAPLLHSLQFDAHFQVGSRGWEPTAVFPVEFDLPLMPWIAKGSREMLGLVVLSKQAFEISHQRESCQLNIPEVIDNQGGRILGIADLPGSSTSYTDTLRCRSKWVTGGGFDHLRCGKVRLGYHRWFSYVFILAARNWQACLFSRA